MGLFPLNRLCEILDCEISDVVQYVPGNKTEQ
ncbi:helix-turn-helix domain-containing protein [Flintibacter sp. NSJ-23]|uniref:Helix-turn-helix domain-containing protein n=2 Tax=Flintibacter hominis TaxID=2763048 RepID=A0A8J6J7S0_9FIRM|nr:helix-turn-helix domain-containing protein [Flintibacter hominis]